MVLFSMFSRELEYLLLSVQAWGKGLKEVIVHSVPICFRTLLEHRPVEIRQGNAYMEHCSEQVCCVRRHVFLASYMQRRFSVQDGWPLWCTKSILSSGALVWMIKSLDWQVSYGSHLQWSFDLSCCVSCLSRSGTGLDRLEGSVFIYLSINIEVAELEKRACMSKVNAYRSLYILL